MPLAPYYVQRWPRKALSFDGVNDYVEAPDSDSLDVVGEMTIDLLLYLDDIMTQKELMSHGAYALGGWVMIKSVYNGPHLYIEIEDFAGGTGCVATNILSRGWHSYAITYDDDADTVRFFKDGTLFRTVSCTRSMTATNQPLRIGTTKKESYFAGKFGRVCFYDYVLTERELKHNSHNPNNPILDGLILWLHWDSIDISAGIWYDKSGYGNHGTIYGATLVDLAKSPYRSLPRVRKLAVVR